MTGKVLAILGYQFGDEGKGKIVDLLASYPNIHCSVRFNGGNNAGHTVVKDGKVYKLHLIPSSVIENKHAIISHGCVVNPLSLLEEIKSLQDVGISVDKLKISDNAHVVLPKHIELDKKMDEKTGIGTTARGIGPTYADKSYRTGLTVSDFENGIITKDYDDAGKALKSYVGNSFQIIHTLLDEGKNIMLEGAQGALLDVDMGSYPFVTSSNTTISGALSGTGLSSVDCVLGVTKAYITRVGSGPMPTELKDETGKKLMEQGKEFGTTTGRARRCGWLDIPLLRYAIKINKIEKQFLVLTKLDVLNGLDKVKIAVAYDVGDNSIEMPFNVRTIGKVEPIYKEMDGWNLDDSEWDKIAKEGYEELPKEARLYIEEIEKLTGVKVAIVSIGPDRNQTILRRDVKELF